MSSQEAACEQFHPVSYLDRDRHPGRITNAIVSSCGLELERRNNLNTKLAIADDHDLLVSQSRVNKLASELVQIDDVWYFGISTN
ncbi:hypothetical protein N7519_000801 [Penicillium mononematosum]|uniref:uncharacterized protein n=1 Tax=Penicillium mononematosum TaxID=268346 RepID=UPI002548F0B9|nr:uncharacterized protein N7519_000801 [Penicillium mononematosum]KAJ6190780.1 hypothetical protein N7519_000801 [Penicillium mononematosum]